MIEKLRDRNNFLLSKCVDKNDEIYIKLSIIKRILNDDKCFFKMSIDDAYNILNDLGYKDNEAINMYKMLVSYKNFIKVSDLYSSI